jgi:hypothetical protein
MRSGEIDTPAGAGNLLPRPVQIGIVGQGLWMGESRGVADERLLAA